MVPIFKTNYNKKSTQDIPRYFKVNILFLVSTLSLFGTIFTFLSHKPLVYKALATSALIISSIALYRNQQIVSRRRVHQKSLTSTPKPINLKALKQGLGS